MKIKLNNIEINLTPNVNLADIRKLNANQDWWNAIIDFLEEWASDKPTITVKTSGSTGEPKVWEVEKVKFWLSATKTCEFFNLNENSTGLLCLSANYIAGKMMLARAMVSGMNLICIEPSDNPVVELNEKIDFCAMVPMQVRESLRYGEKLNQINNLIIGGGQVDYNLQKQFVSFKGNTYETFGMTETLSHIALKQLSPNTSDYFSVLEGVSISKGFKNELIIDYPELGIYKLKTNDIIELGNSSREFRWIGRTDFVINSGGIKVSPEEIEKQIAHLINLPFCIIGLPDEKLGEKVVLVIESEEFESTNLFPEIKKALPSYNCPKEIRFIEKLPLTESGKIIRSTIINLLQKTL